MPVRVPDPGAVEKKKHPQSRARLLKGAASCRPLSSVTSSGITDMVQMVRFVSAKAGT